MNGKFQNLLHIGLVSIINGSFVFSLLLLAFFGCSSRTSSFKAPKVNPEEAAVRAIEIYDADNDQALSEQELAKCPGLLAKRANYDTNGNGLVEQSEIENGVANLLKHGTGGTQLNCLVLYKGQPLGGAEVVLEPEPYLGDQVQTARGTTNGSGAAQLGIPPEYLPEHLRRFKAVHYGTFKIRVHAPF